MSHVIIDRRKNDKGKSSVNRRKFINRVRSTLKEAVKESIGNTNLKDLANGKGKVRIPIRNLEEPSFQHDRSIGEHDMVRPGNEKYRPGDKINRPKSDQGKGNQGSPDGKGQDEFSFHLTKEEFFDLFFENCELPNLFKKSLALLLEEETKRSGYVNDGPPSQLNIVRSMRRAKARRFGLRASLSKRLRELQEEEKQLQQEITARQSLGQDISIEQNRLTEVQKEIETLERKIKAVPFIDPMDLRFTNYSKISLPAVQAVMFCVMDVSGSMDERKKQLAKTFFLLLYLFLERNYENVEIIYVRHHTIAKEVNEEEFYHSLESGGTIISNALELTHNIIKERYPLSQWNVYIAQASDGENYPSDNANVKTIIEDKLLLVSQYFAYIQVSPDEEFEWKSPSHLGVEYDIWNIYKDLADKHTNIGVSAVNNESQVYPAFKKLFEKKKGQHAKI